MMIINSIRFFVLSNLLIYTAISNTVIIKWELDKVCGKKILSVSDLHNNPYFEALEKEQLYCFINQLENYSLTNESPVHIQIEHLDPYYSKSDEGLLTHLKSLLEEKCLEKVTFENSETRGASGCAKDILEFVKKKLKENDKTIDLSLQDLSSQRSTATHTYYVSHVTLKDIKDEYESVIDMVEKKILSIKDPIVKDVLLKRLSTAKEGYVWLIEQYLNLLHERETEPLVDIVQSEWEKNPTYIEYLLDNIFEQSGSFFEISLFAGIFTQDAPFAIIIAGASHIRRLNGIAGSISMTLRECIDAKGDSLWPQNTPHKNIPVVQTSDFTFFEKRPEKIAQCSRCILF
ncbi:hypothetical protein H0X06_01740 [Candidatus Dependentiae bacterium]|nr:hypothetical protein [Candidatus Dependentiae bacterium]